MTDGKRVARMLDVIANDVVPLTRLGVAEGNKVFGSAILRKDDMSLVIAGTNNENENPLWHGEVHTLKLFYEIPAAERPRTEDCIFLATHEPCSLCLSAITWTGFDNFYYLFGYEDTAETFNIPHDLKILQEVFDVKGGNYVRRNAFWTSHSLVDMIAGLPGAEQETLREQVESLMTAYAELSDIYQEGKSNTDIPLP
ncbi:MAG: nucleoside deaminase [Gammaproteobacteria bacterium]|nr:nucleoside deaminase [Gammaproteobacteria bacterium]